METTLGYSLVTSYPGCLPPLKESEEEYEKKLPIWLLPTSAAASVHSQSQIWANLLTVEWFASWGCKRRVVNDHIPSTRLWGAAATAGDLSTWILILFFFSCRKKTVVQFVSKILFWLLHRLGKLGQSSKFFSSNGLLQRLHAVCGLFF